MAANADVPPLRAATPQSPATPPGPGRAPAVAAARTPAVWDLPPVAENLFSVLDGSPRLIGSSCRACGTLAFPQQPSCPRCCGEDVAAALLPAEGTLWSWTVQRFPPKSPPYAGGEAEFRPFAVGYVALDGGIAVQGRLTGAPAPDGYRIGMPMRVVIEPFLRNDGTAVAAYAFAPCAAGHGEPPDDDDDEGPAGAPGEGSASS
jgi:uncharacterized OB-fold protein